MSAPPIGVCSFSFHRLLASGRQDIFQYIKDCKALGCAQLDPWNAHLAPLKDGDSVLDAGRHPERSHQLLSPADEGYIARVKEAAREAGLPFGCIAVDGAHIYEADPEARRINRERAYRWLAIARQLEASQVRIDCGGPENMPDDVFDIIIEGYRDLIGRARAMNIEILIENHWGPSVLPANIEKIIQAAPGLGLLMDSWNWKGSRQAEGWLRCAKYAKATHVKTFHITDEGEELTVNVPAFFRVMREAGYAGAWGIESVPHLMDEMEGVRRAIELIRKHVG